MENHNRKKDRKFGKSILSAKQVKLLIENIRKISSTEGLTKKDVVINAFTETFGNNWPIQPVSSTIDRYWKRAFAFEKTKPKRQTAPLADQPNGPQSISIPNPQIPVVPLECVFHDCPWCRKPIRALVVAAATIMKHEENR